MKRVTSLLLLCLMMISLGAVLFNRRCFAFVRKSDIEWRTLLANISPDPSLPFPPILHQVYLSHRSLNWISEVDEETKQWIGSWTRMNPSLNHIVWNACNFESLLLTEFPSRFMYAYERLRSLNIVLRGDFARYTLLYHFGGIYSDVDTICHRPVHEFSLGHKDVDIIVAVEVR
ncbi:hypothetical protein BC830DRAFT_1079102 [Chytriomyces sp. MP71]|nr:hypothetical protein BC830DRAFT_1079102 [Chytriomyces sp. MP71]